MAAFHVVGIDWATQQKNRAIARLECEETGKATITEVTSPLDDVDAVAACKRSDNAVVAVDIPFGWPQGFKGFVAEWVPNSDRRPPSSEGFRYRQTDLVVKREAGKAPLSVSSNLIAVGAREWIDVCHGHGLERQIDVLGEPPSTSTPRIIEVYPAGTLTALAARTGFQLESYKGAESVRLGLLDWLRQIFSFDFAEGLTTDVIVEGKESDRLDAVIAALTGLLYAASVLGKGASPALADWGVRRPEEDEKQFARKEGWILFPAAARS